VKAAQVKADSLKKGADLAKTDADAAFALASTAFKANDVIYQAKRAEAIAKVDAIFGKDHTSLKAANDKANSVKITTDAVSKAANAELTKLNAKVIAT